MITYISHAKVLGVPPGMTKGATSSKYSLAHTIIKILV
uniref:Uncharacterized protein n=1 Tax=Arundo donax TaxID=35708 RepID=A0A0A8YN75_ARUDO